jgi:chromosome segregation ATPase
MRHNLFEFRSVVREKSNAKTLEDPEVPRPSVSSFEETEHKQTQVKFASALKKENKRLESRNELEGEKEMLRKRNTEEDKELRAKRDNMKDNITLQIEEQNSVMQERDRLKEKKESLVSEIEALNVKLQRLKLEATKREHVNRECNMADIMEENARAAQEVECLNDTKKSLESKIEELIEKGRKPNQNCKKNIVLKSIDDSKKSSTTEMDEEHSNIVQQTKFLKHVKDLLESEIQDRKDEIEKVLERNNQATALMTGYEVMQQKMPKLTEKHSKAVQERDGLRKAKTEMAVKLEALENELKELRQREEEYKALWTKYYNMKGTKKNLVEELNNALQERAYLVQETEKLRSKTEDVKDKIKQLRRRDIEATAFRTEYDRAKDNMAELVQQLNTTNQQIKDLKEAEVKLHSELEDLTSEQERIYSEKKKIKKLELNNALQERACLIQETEKLWSKIEDVRNNVERLRRGDIEDMDCRTEYDKTKHNMAQLIQELNTTSQEIKYLKEAKVRLHSELEDLSSEQERIYSEKKKIKELQLNNALQDRACLMQDTEKLRSKIEEVRDNVESLGRADIEATAVRNLDKPKMFLEIRVDNEFWTEFEVIKLRMTKFLEELNIENREMKHSDESKVRLASEFENLKETSHEKTQHRRHHPIQAELTISKSKIPRPIRDQKRTIPRMGVPRKNKPRIPHATEAKICEYHPKMSGKRVPADGKARQTKIPQHQTAKNTAVQKRPVKINATQKNVAGIRSEQKSQAQSRPAKNAAAQNRPAKVNATQHNVTGIRSEKPGSEQASQEHSSPEQACKGKRNAE